MAIARKPNSKPKPPVTDDAADAFIAGAAKPAAPAIAEAAEDGPRTLALSGLTPPAEPVPGEERADPAQHTFWVLSGPDARSADRIGRRLLARTHPHGRWLAWMGD